MHVGILLLYLIRADVDAANVSNTTVNIGKNAKKSTIKKNKQKIHPQLMKQKKTLYKKKLATESSVKTTKHGIFGKIQNHFQTNKIKYKFTGIGIGIGIGCTLAISYAIYNQYLKSKKFTKRYVVQGAQFPKVMTIIMHGPYIGLRFEQPEWLNDVLANEIHEVLNHLYTFLNLQVHHDRWVAKMEPLFESTADIQSNPALRLYQKIKIQNHIFADKNYGQTLYVYAYHFKLDIRSLFAICCFIKILKQYVDAEALKLISAWNKSRVINKPIDQFTMITPDNISVYLEEYSPNIVYLQLLSQEINSRYICIVIYLAKYLEQTYGIKDAMNVYLKVEKLSQTLYTQTEEIFRSQVAKYRQ